ncbi:MAG TPA: hypothetical protein ENI95_05455 [Chloroflexi bacterium]|nr:hypothetical protein [Chloroflexota bacterium]
MRTLVQFVARIDVFVYALAAVGIFFAIRGLFQARRAMRVAVFGLEREAARRKRRGSLSMIIILLALAGAVYVTSNIVAPNIEGLAARPTETPPIVFVSPEPTATQPLLLYPTITPTIGLPPAEAGTEAPPEPAEVVNGCEIIGANITSPEPNQAVSGQVVVEGQANILGFAQYKFEIQGPGTGGDWVVVGTFTEPVNNGILGTWDSTSLMPGNYTLRLVVSRQDGTFPTPCEVPIVIVEPLPSGP